MYQDAKQDKLNNLSLEIDQLQQQADDELVNKGETLLFDEIEQKEKEMSSLLLEGMMKALKENTLKAFMTSNYERIIQAHEFVLTKAVS